MNYKSSAVAEMGNCGHNRHGPKRGRAAEPLSRRARTQSNTMWSGPRSTSIPSGVFIHLAVWPQDMGQQELSSSWDGRPWQICERDAVRLWRSTGNPSNTMWPARRSTSVPSGIFIHAAFQPFGHNSVGCHSPRRNISTNYYFVVEMLTVTVCSDDARQLLNKKASICWQDSARSQFQAGLRGDVGL